MMPEMVEKLIRLRYSAVCSHCGSALSPGAQGWWDSDERAATCPDCHSGNGGPLRSTAPDNPSDEDPTRAEVPTSQQAGASARNVHEQKYRRREERIERKWGAAAGVVKFLSKEPQSAKAWAKGSQGERRLATLLAKGLGEKAVVLHDRQVPGSKANIDHVAVAPSGIWIIDAKNYEGKVEQRAMGGVFTSDQRLYVDDRDRTNLVSGLAGQINAVLDAVGGTDVPVDAALCFLDAEWGFFTKPFRLEGVLVTWPRRLCETIGAPGPVPADDVKRLAERLAAKLPPSLPVA